MNEAQKAAMRAALDATLERTIASYHGFMEGTVHAKAEGLLDEAFRAKLIDDLAAAADGAASS